MGDLGPLQSSVDNLRTREVINSYESEILGADAMPAHEFRAKPGFRAFTELIWPQLKADCKCPLVTLRIVIHGGIRSPGRR